MNKFIDIDHKGDMLTYFLNDEVEPRELNVSSKEIALANGFTIVNLSGLKFIDVVYDVFNGEHDQQSQRIPLDDYDFSESELAKYLKKIHR